MKIKKEILYKIRMSKIYKARTESDVAISAYGTCC